MLGLKSSISAKLAQKGDHQTGKPRDLILLEIIFVYRCTMPISPPCILDPLSYMVMFTGFLMKIYGILEIP